MKSNLLQYYLNWNVKCYVLIILGISCLIVYVQQEYITSNPQLSSSASFLRLNVLSSLN